MRESIRARALQKRALAIVLVDAWVRFPASGTARPPTSRRPASTPPAATATAPRRGRGPSLAKGPS
eukprot:12441328-Alexandrium_andersonii.AAC.2